MSGVALNLVVLRSLDIVRSAAFYSRLGLRFERHRHGSGPEHFAAALGDRVFEIYPLSPDGPPTLGTRVGFSVSALDSIVAGFDDCAEVVVLPPKDSPWGRRAVLSDPDGHRVELVEK